VLVVHPQTGGKEIQLRAKREIQYKDSPSHNTKRTLLEENELQVHKRRGLVLYLRTTEYTVQFYMPLREMNRPKA
jgi:hypothetical protein